MSGCCGSQCLAQKSIFYMSPAAGMHRCDIQPDGKPGPWVLLAADAILITDGGKVGGAPVPPGIPPVPDPADPIVKQIETISRNVLKNKEEATAVAAIVNSIAKLNLSPSDFKESLEMAAPIADASLNTQGRIGEWVHQATLVTVNPQKLIAGVSSAWGISASTLESIHAAAVDPESVATGEAINWSQLIQIIMMILELLKNLGIGG